MKNIANKPNFSYTRRCGSYFAHQETN